MPALAAIARAARSVLFGCRTDRAHAAVVADDDQRIDSGRRVKCAGQVHCNHRHTNRQRRSPRCRSAQLEQLAGEMRWPPTTARG